MLRGFTRALVALTAAMLLWPGAAQADKAHDTLRVAFDQPIRLIDGDLNPNPEGDLVNRAVFDTLVAYDAKTRTYHGQIAESWQQVDDKTMVLKLRANAKFSDGTPVTADDVIYSFKYGMDPSANFLFKDSRFGWIDHVDKIDDATIRVVAKQPTAIMLSRLWAAPEIIPEHVHAKLADRATFGLHPVGSGPYKVESFDPSTGTIALVKNPLYDWGGFEPPASIGRVEITTIPDAQTRYAKIMVGDLDLIFNVDNDQAQNIAAANPATRIYVAPTVSYSYILFDTADRTGIHVFKDKRVREALLRAIDVQGMRKAMLPPEFAAKPAMQAMCVKTHVGCAWTEAPVSYDPAKAKQLLAEAGLAGGFDLVLSTWGPARPVAEAVAGDFRKIGVRASVNAMPINAFQTARGEGKLQTMVTQWDNGGGVPDIDTTAEFYFPPSTRNYIGDPLLAQMTDDAAKELDPQKREALYAKLFDRVTEEDYMMPLVEFPAIMVLAKDIVVDSNHLKPEGFVFDRLSWTN
ncbi:MAG TPA: ABC transporter substrate-binding protein [Stellaceae bacterium]|nr:ABC transporter substrate-binding protein [Stellaceae bacterium]